MTGEGSLFDVPPAAIGRYRVQHPLGAGTCGPVFRAESPDGTSVAVKLLTIPVRPERVDDVLDGLQHIVADGRSVAGTVEPLDAGLHDGSTPFLVTALAPGDALDVALRRFGPALLTDVLPRLSLLAGALDDLASRHLHHGALHLRDLMVDEASTLMTGIGVWHALAAGGVRLPRRSPYRAPDLADLALSSAGDQFSLAAVAYEWMTGRRAPAAFVAGDMAASAGVRREALGAVFARAMHLDPDHRYPSCQAFVDDLRRVDSGQAEPAQPVMAPEDRPRRRTRQAVEPLPLLTLEPDGDSAPDMPLQTGMVSRDMEPAAAVPDFPLQAVEPPRELHLSAMPMSEAALEFATGPIPVPTPAPDEAPVYVHALSDLTQLDDARSTTGGERISRTDGADDEAPNDALRLAPAVASAAAVTLADDGRAVEVPPVPVSGAPGPLPLSRPSDGWGTRLLLVSLGVALGLTMGYAVWGRSDETAQTLRAEIASPPGAAPAAVPVDEPALAPSSGPATGRTEAGSASSPAPGSPSAAAVPPKDELQPGRLPESAPSASGRASASPERAPQASRAAAPRGRTTRQTPSASPRVTPARRGAVRAISTPPGAMVMLDGRLVGKSPMTVRNVAPGSHTIEFRRQGHRPVMLPVQVKAGATARASATLPRAQEPQ